MSGKRDHENVVVGVRVAVFGKIIKPFSEITSSCVKI